MYRDKLEKIYWEETKRNLEEKDLTAKGVFEIFYGHLQQVFLHGILEREMEKDREIPRLSKELLEVFTKHMQRISLRTIILKMAKCEENGKLLGKTPQERYEDYQRRFLNNPEYLKELYNKYPDLYESIMRTLENWVHNIIEVLERFNKDKDEINQRFFAESPCREIQQISGGDSDSHRNGQRVFIVELDNGKSIVYKPRNLAVDKAYGIFLRWVYENTGISCWWYQVINKEKYGWCQWVTSDSCNSKEELARYYCRMGVLLCVSYLLGSEDIHYENFVAHGEFPVIIDLELAIGCYKTKEKIDLTMVERFYIESVLRSGILPSYVWNGKGNGINVGAMNGEGGQFMPALMPIVMNSGTVKMHIEYRHPVTGKGKNLATLNGEFFDPCEFLNEIQAGFEQAYDFLIKNKEKTVRMLDGFRDVPIRYLVRDTQQYSMILMTLGHPDLLTIGSDKQIVWNVLKNYVDDGRAAKWIWQQEIKELLQGDVPYFYYSVSGNRLCSGTGEMWEKYFEDTAMAGIHNRLNRMCNEDLQYQKKLIHRVLLLETKKVNTDNLFLRREILQHPVIAAGRKKVNQENEWEQDRIKTAEKIADILLENAVWSEDKTEVGWINTIVADHKGKNYMVRPMDFYLYGGLAGVALFMAQLEEKTKKSKYCNVRESLFQSLFRHTDTLIKNDKPKKFHTGAYCGEASIALSYLLLYSIKKDPIFLSYLQKQCQATAKQLEEDQEFDVLSGNAGAILVYLKAYELTGEKQYIEWARVAGDYLLQAATLYDYGMGWVNPSTGIALTGFAHGNAGIMLAFSMLGYYIREKKFFEAAYQAYQYEEYYYREDLKDWEDLRSNGHVPQENHGMAWCHGWGGIVMARISAMKYVNGRFQTELQKVRSFIKKKLVDQNSDKNILLGEKFCLCHGLFGNLAILKYIGLDQAEQVYGMIIEELCIKKVNIYKLLDTQESENYGLMGGIAGVGYSCLCNLDNVAKILCVK